MKQYSFRGQASLSLPNIDLKETSFELSEVKAKASDQDKRASNRFSRYSLDSKLGGNETFKSFSKLYVSGADQVVEECSAYLE